MGNLGLTAITTASVGKKATLDANYDILDLALSNPHTGDMSAGNVSLSNAEFRQNIFFLGSGVATAGRTFTIPNIERPFLLYADAANTDPFTLIKGATSLAVQPGDTAWFVSGPGANDLTKVGVDGAAAGVVRSPYEVLKAGFDGPGDSGANGLWTAPTDSGGAAMKLPTIYEDSAGIAGTIDTDGVMEIPAASGIRQVALRANALVTNPNSQRHGWGLRRFRGYNGGTDETGLVFPDILAITRESDFFDNMETHAIQSPMVAVRDGDRIENRYVSQGVGLFIQPFNPRGFAQWTCEVVEREASLTKPEPLPAFIPGTPTASAIVAKFPIVRPIKLQDAFAGSFGRCGTNPSSATVFDILVDGVKLGQVSFSTGGAATFSYVADGALTITNPGFETGDLTGWTSLHGSGGSVVSTTPHTGTYCFNATNIFTQGLQQLGIATPGGEANLIDAGLRVGRLSWYDRSLASPGRFFAGGFRMEDSSGYALARTVWDPAPWLYPDSTYHQKTVEWPVPPNTRLINIYLEQITTAFADVRLDDVAFDFVSKDIVLRQGSIVTIQAPGALNGIADIAITIAGRLV